MLNKIFITNFIALIVVIAGYFAPIPEEYREIVRLTGLFALSGGVTNWIAIHMLFEKVPFLYGSGVIPSRFEEFKSGIKTLIINEFFNKEHIEKFFSSEVKTNISSSKIVEKVDFDKIFNGLVEAIMESSLGGMLNMVGGASALEPLKEPIKIKMQEMIGELADDMSTSDMSGDIAETLIGKVEVIVDKRLDELTPQKVKEIIQDMIRKHLGWLVVWGGIFGGIMGFVVSIL